MLVKKLNKNKRSEKAFYSRIANKNAKKSCKERRKKKILNKAKQAVVSDELGLHKNEDKKKKHSGENQTNEAIIFPPFHSFAH